MVYYNISDLPQTTERAVIINVGTRLITTLAVLSAIRFAKMPILLVDCSLEEGNTLEYNYFQDLMDRYDFDLISMPLLEHGLTLDKILCEIKSEYILLIDSDLEILNDEIVFLMKKFIRSENIFGTGFTQGPSEFEAGAWEFKKEGFYEERMWIPFLMLETSKIKEAILNGNSFKLRTFYNLFPFWPKISKYLLRRFPVIFESHLFDFLRIDYHGKKPPYTMLDTGTQIYQYLRYNKKYFFVGPNVDSGVEEDFVFHYNGMTRKQMYPDDSHNSVSVESMSDRIIDRLKQKYNFDFK